MQLSDLCLLGVDDLSANKHGEMVSKEHDELALPLYDVSMENSVWVVQLSLSFRLDWDSWLLLCHCACVAVLIKGVEERF